MNEPVKLDPSELTELTSLKDGIQRIMFEFGELYLEKMELDVLFSTLSEKESGLRNKMSDLKKREATLMDSILKKYGVGSLNIREGVFTPTENLK